MIVYEDLKRLNSFDVSVSRTQDIVNDIVSEFNSYPLKKIKNQDQVADLVSDMPGFLAKMLPGDDTKLFGIKIKPDKAIDLLDIDTKNLKHLIEQVDRRYLHDFLQVCIIKNDQFIVDPDKVEKHKDNYRVFAKTVKEKTVAEAYANVIDALNRMVDLGLPLDVLKHGNFHSWLTHEQGKIMVNINMFKKLTG